jgi:hypothetical protein
MASVLENRVDHDGKRVTVKSDPKNAQRATKAKQPSLL